MLATLAVAACSWTTISQARFGAQIEDIQRLQHHNWTVPGAAGILRTLGYLWTYPANTDDARGLGGGIAWTWDREAICGEGGLLHLFREDLFFASLVGCHDLQAAMHRAFQTWSDNHPSINFLDVTDECLSQYGTTSFDCPLTEIWVTAREDEAQAGVEGTLEVASALPITEDTSDFRYTNGETPGTVVRVTKQGLIKFGRASCWYLDSTFCSQFHKYKQTMGAQALELTGSILTFVISGGAALMLLLQIFLVLNEHCTTQRSFKERCKKAGETFAKWSPAGNSLRLVCLITPVLFWRQIFTPCFQCYDFEAAAVHEVGHILGLGHPDLASEELLPGCSPNDCGPPGQDVQLSAAAAAVPMNNVTCMHTWDAVVPRPAGSPVRDAQMISFTQHNPNVCLSADDLEGLYALYPACTHAIDTPICFKTKHNIGWVRLGVYFLFPCILALFLAMLCAGCAHKEQRKRLQSARNLLRKKSSLFGRAILRLSQVQSEASQLREERQEAKANEDARVHARVEEEVARRTSQASVADARRVRIDPASGDASEAPSRPLRAGDAPTTHRSGSLRWLGALMQGGRASGRAEPTPRAAAKPKPRPAREMLEARDVRVESRERLQSTQL